MKSEAKLIALLRHPTTHVVVGRLYLWESGETDPMWIEDEFLDAVAEPIAGEIDSWSDWKLNE